MTSGSGDLFSLAERKLDWLEDRQRVLARNVANANTPNFEPSDERPFEAALSGFMVAPVRTNAMHLGGTDNAFGTIKVPGHERSPDGNRVSVEDELTKVAETDNQQRLVTNIYSKYMAMFSTALGKG
ncbi:flagellar basal body rod protein FlgB [Lichenicoccus roseus]|uniref:Flagellar biosynthesis protein FlgB n=1 Tax=Lichenicoccus roseus TaxID=2683649 RepID=A0A5R9J687_9PROT|nr:flagellar biosynthesis protein FlgB [Lichenicoccus roseus]TLU73130.1 flagellar biosynthesis protein FlgB [Lichenicoccus roseus]